LVSGLWHERGYWDFKTGLNGAERVSCHAFWKHKNYVGDIFSGKIYELSLETYTDNGNPIKRVRTGGHIHSDRQRLFFNEFEIDLERGTGNADFTETHYATTSTTSAYTVEAEPKACLQWSDDGGITWSNEYWGTPGRSGQYKSRLHWHRLGYSRDRVFRLTVSAPVRWVLIAARADIVKEAP
jgi:hypothetical protein